MPSLGWKVAKEGEYKVDLPMLSEDEEFLLHELEIGFREVTRIKDFESEEEILKELKQSLERICADNGYEIDNEQLIYLSKIAYLHIFGLGFLEQLLKDSRVEEIAVIRVGEPAYVYLKGKGWVRTNAVVTSTHYLMELVNKMANPLGRRITLQHPTLDTTLADGSRLHASLPPVSKGELTIRKFDPTPLSIKQLYGFKALPIEAVSLLSFFMQGDFSLLIAGNTASGKTTLLNSLFAFVPYNERIVITEETPEIDPPQEHKVRMLASKEMGISLMDLVYDTLRMRPDRMVVGEIRNASEARALLDVLLAGQARGAYATFHGKSIDEALSRLRSFGLSDVDIGSIDVLMVQRRMLIYSRETRSVEERRRLHGLAILEGSKPLNVITYSLTKDEWKLQNLPKVFSLISSRIGLTEKEVKEEFEHRKTLILEAPEGFGDFYSFYQREVYGFAK